MYYGIIETEFLENIRILDKFNILNSYEESHPEDEIKIWVINKICFNSADALKLIKEPSEAMNEGWYFLIWDDEFVWVIFHRKIFKIKNENPWGKRI